MANNRIKVATLAIVAVASLGTSYYFLKTSASADLNAMQTSPPSLPTNNANIALPPVPAAPVNQSTGDTSSTGSSTLNSNSDFNSSFTASPVSATNEDFTTMDTFGIDNTTSDQPATTGSSINSGSLSETTANPTGSSNSSLNNQIPDQQSQIASSIPSSTTASTTAPTPPQSKLFGIVAAVISGIAFIILIAMLVRGRNQSVSTPVN